MTTPGAPRGRQAVTQAFCPDCRTMREVMDEYLTDDGDQYRENAGQGSGAPTYLARPLECGHSADDGSGRPAVSPDFQPDPALVDRVAELQRGGC